MAYLNSFAFLFVAMFHTGAWAASSSEAYYDKALVFYQNEELSSAVIELKNSLKKNSANFNARAFLGRIYLQQGQLESAKITFLKLEKSHTDPNSWIVPLAQIYSVTGQQDETLKLSPEKLNTSEKSALAYWRGEAFLEINQYNNAKAAFQKSKDLDKNNLNALIGLAKFEAAKANFAQAETVISDVLKKDPSNVAALSLRLNIIVHLKKSDKMLPTAEKLLRLQPYNQDALLAKLQYLANTKQYALADAVIRQVKKYYPRNAIILYFSSVLAFEQQQYAQTINRLEQMLSLVPTHDDSRFLLAKAYYFSNKYDIAKTHLSNLLRRHSNNYNMASLMSIMLMKQQQPDKAVELLTPFKVKQSENTDFYALLGLACFQAKRYEESEQYLKRALVLDPLNSDVVGQLTLSLLLANKHTEAKATLRAKKAVMQDGFQYEFLTVLLLMQEKSYPIAEQRLAQLIESAPNEGTLYGAMGKIYYAQKKYNKAEMAFQKSMQLNPGNRAYDAYSLVQISLQRGHLAHAEQALSKILEQYPDDLPAVLLLAKMQEKRGELKAAVGLLQTFYTANPNAFLAGSNLVPLQLKTDPKTALNTALSLSNRFNNLESDLLLAQAWLANRKGRQAIDLLLSLLAQEKRATYRILLAEAYRQEKQYSKALALIDQISDDQYALSVKLLKIDLLLKLSRFFKANQSLKPLLKSHPNNIDVLKLAGRVRFSSKKMPEALAFFEKSFALQESRDLLLIIRDLKKKLGLEHAKLLQSWLEHHPEDAGVYLILALDADRDHNNPLAIARYQKVLQLKPKNIIALNNIALKYLADGQIDKAEATVNQLSRLSNEAPGFLDTIGWVFHQSGKHKKALGFLQLAAAKSDNPSIQFHYASVLVVLGKTRKSEIILQQLLQAKKPFPEMQAAQQLYNQL